MAPGPRVLRGAQAQTFRGVAIDADLSLLAGAARPAAALTPAELEQAASQAREAAARAGYEDGFAAGQRDAAAAAEQIAAGAAQAVNHAIGALEHAAAQLLHSEAPGLADVEGVIVRTAVAIAEAVVGRELRALDDPAREAIARALQLAPDRIDAVARINPADAATLHDITDLAADRAVTVVADDTVERGGCVLDVGPCRVDAQIGPAIRRVREALGQ
ncbi:MAG TPA: FliH/SctL family protein [Egibacteraceae bacterium]|nr:FliH/SctL family protein [Egibacteraceae bacterium]